MSARRPSFNRIHQSVNQSTLATSRATTAVRETRVHCSPHAFSPVTTTSKGVHGAVNGPTLCE